MVSFKRVLKLCAAILLFLVSVYTYVTYFFHPSSGVIIRQNKLIGASLIKDFDANNILKAGIQNSNREIQDTSKNSDAGQAKLDPLVLENSIIQADYWEQVVRANSFIIVGAVYDKCNGHKTQLGVVILEEDKASGGIMTRTLFNMTLEKELNGGEFHLQVKYNGRHLYDNYWQLCDLEQKLPIENRTFTCPVAPGKWSKQKRNKVPSYLPSGRYQTQAWATDETNSVIICGFTDFQI